MIDAMRDALYSCPFRGEKRKAKVKVDVVGKIKSKSCGHIV